MKEFVDWAGTGVAAATVPAHSPAKPAATRPESLPRGASTFRWSWKLVRVAGIDVYVHGTFLLLIAFIAFGDLVTGHGVAAMVRGTWQSTRCRR